MPLYSVRFVRSVECLVEAESKEAVAQAAKATVDLGVLNRSWEVPPWRVITEESTIDPKRLPAEHRSELRVPGRNGTLVYKVDEMKEDQDRQFRAQLLRVFEDGDPV